MRTLETGVEPVPMLRPRQLQITALEAGTILLVMTAAIGSLEVPGLVSRPALHNGWIAVPLAGMFGLLSLALVGALARRFPNETIIQYAPKLLGGLGGKVIGLVFILFSIIWAGFILREFSDFVLTTSLPRTPISVIVGIIALTMVHGARQGIEVLGRLAVLFTPLALLIVAVVLGFGAQQTQFVNLQPFMAHGLAPILGAALEAGGFFGTSVLMAVVLAFCPRPGRARSAAFASLVLVILILTVATAGVDATFNDLAGRFTYPFFSFARVAGTGPVAFRADAFIISLEFVGLSAKAMIWLFIISYSLAQWLNLSEYKGLVTPVAAIVIAVSILFYSSRSDMSSFLQYAYPIIALVWQLVLPGIMFGAAIIRGRRSAAGYA